RYPLQCNGLRQANLAPTVAVVIVGLGAYLPTFRESDPSMIVRAEPVRVSADPLAGSRVPGAQIAAGPCSQRREMPGVPSGSGAAQQYERDCGGEAAWQAESHES